jgi:hypothetical protein
LFIDPDVAGGLTDDEPESPALDMSIAIVTRSHASTGIIFVRMWNQGVDLGEINDVLITTPADEQILAYDATAGIWKNIDIPESAAVISSATAPANTTAIWFNTENGNTYIYYDDFWTSIAGSTGAPIISDTAPTDPVLGTQWFNSSTGKSYLYYSNAWVEIDSNGTAAQPSGNAIINGGFDFWQRGTSFTASGYSADRWYSSISGTTTVSRESTIVPDDSTFALKWTTGASNSFSSLFQALEYADVKSLWGKTVTFSAFIRAQASFVGNVSLLIQTGTSQDSLLTGTWTNLAQTSAQPSTSEYLRISVTTTIPTSTNGLRVSIGPSATQASGTGIYIAKSQLEAGPVATPFKRNAPSIQAELAACQRYYERIGTGTIGRISAATIAEFYLRFNEKRTLPTFSLTRTNPQFYDPAVGTKTGTASTIISVVGPTVSGHVVQISGFTGLVAGNFAVIINDNYVEVIAEL